MDGNQPSIPHMKAMDVPFHLMYDSLICFKGLQSDRPKCKRLFADPGEYQNMIIKYLSVGLQSWFSYQQVALIILFHMRYDSMLYSKKQPSDSPRGWGSSKSSTSQERTLQSVTPLLLIADQATIPHIKGNFYSYHVRYGSMICSNLLQSYSTVFFCVLLG